MVLIIAEEPAAREVYGELFAMRGYDVSLAAGARDGLRAARDRRVGVVVLAMATGATQLRRKLTALRPFVRVHIVGMLPQWCDVLTPQRQQLH
jgi:DNA-binding NtrC family response regulator